MPLLAFAVLRSNVPHMCFYRRTPPYLTVLGASRSSRPAVVPPPSFAATPAASRGAARAAAYAAAGPQRSDAGGAGAARGAAYAAAGPRRSDAGAGPSQHPLSSGAAADEAESDGEDDVPLAQRRQTLSASEELAWIDKAKASARIRVRPAHRSEQKVIMSCDPRAVERVENLLTLASVGDCDEAGYTEYATGLVADMHAGRAHQTSLFTGHGPDLVSSLSCLRAQHS